jgi:hypothetical protein
MQPETTSIAETIRFFVPAESADVPAAVVLDAAGLDDCLFLLDATLNALHDGAVTDPGEAAGIVEEQTLLLCCHLHDVLLASFPAYLPRLTAIRAVFAGCLGQLRGTPGDLRTAVMQDILTRCHERVDGAIHCYGVLHALPAERQRILPAWWRTHLQQHNRYEWISMVQANGDRLDFHLRLFTGLQLLPPAAPHGTLLSGTINAICRFEPLFPLIQAGTVDVQQLTTKLFVFGDTAFNAAYFKACLPKFDRAGEATFKRFARADAIGGFTRDGVMRVRDRGTTVHVCVHEAMHALSDPTFGDTFGEFLDEAATEYLAQSVCGMAIGSGTYPYQVRMIDFLVRACRISMADLVAAYFTGKLEPIADAIRWISGEEGLKALLQPSDHPLCRDVYDNWHAAVRQRREQDTKVALVLGALEFVRWAGQEVDEFAAWWDEPESDSDEGCLTQ